MFTTKVSHFLVYFYIVLVRGKFGLIHAIELESSTHQMKGKAFTVPIHYCCVTHF